MRSCVRLSRSVKLAASSLVCLFFITHCYFNYTAKKQASPHCEGSILGLAVKDPSCLSGFYSQDELKPRLQRPPQDPWAPGAHGKPFEFHVKTPEELQEELQGFNKNQFNQFASDRISLHRDLGEDTRPPECLEQTFLRCPRLPTTSVIIVFHNEAWSALLRTVYSVLHTAPAALLTEVLLVDDASTDAQLQAPLDEYVQQLQIVHVLRQRERKGLITARLMGARAARGEILTFLDSHCECISGWLEPLLARIAEQPTAVVSPQIVSINRDDLSFHKPATKPQRHSRGKFDWRLRFGWETVPEEEMKQRKSDTCPIRPLQVFNLNPSCRTPVFAGGLFSVSKSYFEHIGAYDEHMEFWGGENLEMSFRVWQCGGLLEILPCSVVGHIFRKKSPHTFPNGSSVIVRNLVRLAEVWMDDYKQVFYRTNRLAGSIFKMNSFGNVSERHKLRGRLKCKNFTWYLNNVYPEAYVPEIRPVKHGQLENTAWKCRLDAKRTKRQWNPGQRVKCKNQGDAQYFEYTSKQEIRLSAGIEMCLHAAQGKWVCLERCRLKENAAPEQVWIITQTDHVKNPSSGKCLTVAGAGVVLAECQSSGNNQSWIFI